MCVTSHVCQRRHIRQYFSDNYRFNYFVHVCRTMIVGTIDEFGPRMDWVRFGLDGSSSKIFKKVRNFTVTDIRSQLSASKMEAVELVSDGDARWDEDRRVTEQSLIFFPMFTFMSAPKFAGRVGLGHAVRG